MDERRCLTGLLALDSVVDLPTEWTRHKGNAWAASGCQECVFRVDEGRMQTTWGACWRNERQYGKRLPTHLFVRGDSESLCLPSCLGGRPRPFEFVQVCMINLPSARTLTQKSSPSSQGHARNGYRFPFGDSTSHSHFC